MKTYLNKPLSQIQEVLYYLIKRIKIDRRQMMLSCGVLNLPEQIRRLRHRHGLNIALNEIKTMNKFGREVTFGTYELSNKKDAAEIYNEIQKSNL